MTGATFEPESLFGSSTAGLRLTASDWSTTSLGSPSAWGPELRTAVRICMASREPCALFAGEALTFMCNETYREQLPAGIEELLATDLSLSTRWPPPKLRSMMTSAITRRGALPEWDKLNSALAEAFDLTGFASSLDAVPGESRILGLLHRIVSNGSGRADRSRHSATLHLADDLKGTATVDQALALSAGFLGRSLGLERAGFAVVERDQDSCTITGEWVADPAMISLRGRHRLGDFGPLISATMRSGDDMFVEDVQDRIDTYHDDYADQFVDLGVRAMVNIPIMRNGALEAIFYGHHRTSRKWMPDEALLARDAAERTWSVVEQINDRARLENMHARLILALEAGGLATWEWDISAQTTEWSEEMYNMLGYAAGGLAPSFEAWSERLHPQDAEDTLAALSNARGTSTVFDRNFRIMQPNGEVRWCSGRGTYFYSPDGNAVRMVLLMEDITQEVLSEAHLRDSEERFRLIVDSARDYAIFTTDGDGYIDGWPPGAKAVFGWNSEEAIGQHASILFVAEDRANGVPDREMNMAREEGVAPDVRWHRHKDGGRVFIDGSVRPLWRNPGELRGYLKIGQDTTQKRKADLALRSSEERFRILTNAIPHLVFRGTTNGERIWNSQQWLNYTGQTENSASTFGWLEAIHPEDRAATLTAWDKAATSGEYLAEHRIRRAADGVFRWHQTRAVPVAGSNFAENEWVGTSSDVDDRRQDQDRQDLMFSELQHRTYNLLGVVRAIFSETMAEATSLSAFKSQFSDRLAALSRVHGMLGRSSTGRASIGDLLKLELDALAKDDSRVSLSGPEVEIRPSSVQVLSLAVHELCTNALKYGALSNPKGKLRISWTVASEQDGGQNLELVWEEKYGRRISRTQSGAGGFGRQLIEQALPYQLGAQTSFDLGPERLVCKLTVPIHEIGKDEPD